METTSNWKAMINKSGTAYTHAQITACRAYCCLHNIRLTTLSCIAEIRKFKWKL